MDDETDSEHERVRIAVIDTGIDPTDAYAEVVKKYKDFVDNNDANKQDKTGHGTNSVKLIFKVFGDAEVYVARVFENSNASSNTQDLMEKVRQHSRRKFLCHALTKPGHKMGPH